MVVFKKVASVHEFDCWMVFICLLNELFDDIFAGVPEGDCVVNITFQSQWFVGAYVEDLFFDLPHEDIGKGYRYLSAHVGPVCLQVVPFVKLERGFWQNES